VTETAEETREMTVVTEAAEEMREMTAATETADSQETAGMPAVRDGAQTVTETEEARDPTVTRDAGMATVRTDGEAHPLSRRRPWKVRNRKDPRAKEKTTIKRKITAEMTTMTE